MIQSLKLYEDKKVKLLSRMQINEILDFFAKKTDDYPVVFLSHQTHLPMNYAYYDILSCGFPFVHNSKVLKARGLGYAYDEVDIRTASEQIKTAIQSHSVPKALNDVKSFLYENDPYHPDVIDTFKSLLSCGKERPIEAVTSPVVLTYDNAPTKGTERLCKTLDHHTWTYNIVGNGETWDGWKTRAKGYKRILDTMPDDTIVICSDARDVLCLRNSKTFLDAFESYHAELIVSMELTSGGIIGGGQDPVYNCVPLTEYWAYHNCTDIPLRRFVNAGLVCGRARALREFVNWFLESEYDDDQYALGKYMNMFPDRVCADVEAKLLHTTNFGINGGIQHATIQASDSPTVAELSGRGAFFLHIPHGVSKGQAHLYTQICTIIDAGISEHSMNELYNIDTVRWNHASLLTK
jgi:hypothetical protein